MTKSIAIALLVCLLASALVLAKDPSKINDDTITDQIRINLANDKVIGAYPFEVNVKNGVVTLTGTTDTPGQRSRAASVAKKVKGVKSVVNNIALKNEGPKK
ncbi:MAG TPA: BON domain-containing protein [Candidatus Acidoferrales bacterium]|nr:BON domain-containing protein [Candidatus Acidoferrales bacterium]